MKQKNNVKIQTRVLFLSANAIFIFLVLGLASWFTTHSIQNEIQRVLGLNIPLSRSFTVLTENVLETELYLERCVGYRMGGLTEAANKSCDTFEDLISKQDVQDALTTADEVIGKSKKMVSTEVYAESFGGYKQKLDKFKAERKNYIKSAEKAIKISHQGLSESAIQKTVELSQSGDTLSATMKDLLKEVDESTAHDLKEITRHETTGLILLGSIGVFGLLAIALQAVFTLRSITISISDIARKMSATTKTLNNASQNLAGGAEELSQQSTNISGASTQMSQNLTIVAGAVEEMTTSISEVTRQAVEAAKVAQEANEAATRNTEIVEELGAGAQAIGVVTESIADIADQTNLLALNAAIEAAGAGEAGRGFAVVASEVKELARQAAESADDIKRRIDGIQRSTRESVEAISTISGVISNLNSTNMIIANTMEEQSITTREISNNINQAAEGAEQVSRSMEEITIVAGDGAENAEKIFALTQGLDELSDSLSSNLKQS